MKSFLLVGVFSAMVVLAGCSNNDSNPPVNPPPVPTRGVDVQAPGVEVKAGRDGVDVKAPGTDVQVERK